MRFGLLKAVVWGLETLLISRAVYEMQNTNMIFAPRKAHSKAKMEQMNKYRENKEIIKDMSQGLIIKLTAIVRISAYIIGKERFKEGPERKQWHGFVNILG